VLLRFKKKPIINGDGEGILFELEEFEKTHSRMVNKALLHPPHPRRAETHPFPSFVLV
jgi:hypothetical protein